MEVLVVGAGIAGCSIARILADKGVKIAVCERRSGIGDCAFDYCDPRYFTDQYQGIPEQSYTAMMRTMLDRPNIKTLLNTDAGELGVREGENWRGNWKSVVYTGNITDFFKNRFGPLPYRSLRFELVTYDMEFYQPVAVVNCPNDYDFTRITEFKHFGQEKLAKTTVMFEYPATEGEPCYPLPVKSAEELYGMYKTEADKISNVVFLGRTGQYRYLDMDQVVSSAQKLAESIA